MIKSKSLSDYDEFSSRLIIPEEEEAEGELIQKNIPENMKTKVRFDNHTFEFSEILVPGLVEFDRSWMGGVPLIPKRYLNFYEHAYIDYFSGREVKYQTRGFKGQDLSRECWVCQQTHHFVIFVGP